MKSRIFQWLAIVLIVEVGLLHYFTAQSEYEEAAYMGYLFMLNFLGALVAAFGIYHRQVWGWGLGALVAAVSIVGYVLSRTAGMPGMEVETWLEPYGIVAMTVEGLFLLLTLMRPWKMVPPPEEQPSKSFRSRYLWPVSAVLVLGLTSVVPYQWDAYLNQPPPHEHVGTLAQVCNTPLTSLAELEEKYGIKVSLVAVSEMGSVIDVRLKIIDPNKAHQLLVNQAALLVDQQALVLAPHLHNHYKLKPDKLYFMFFSSQQNTIHSGSEVSLVFGHVRVEPITVK